MVGRKDKITLVLTEHEATVLWMAVTQLNRTLELWGEEMTFSEEKDAARPLVYAVKSIYKKLERIGKTRGWL